MQINFQKESMDISELRANHTETLLVEGDVIVPDIKPDMKEILLTEATAVLTEQTFSSGKLSIAGIVMGTILYIPDQEEKTPKQIETKFDFKDVLDLGITEPLEISGKAGVEHIEFSLLNSRKLNMKVAVSVSVKGYQKRELTLLTGTEETCPLQVRKKQISAYQVLSDRAEDFVVTETLEIPGVKPDIDEIIKLSAKAFKGDCRIMSGKILLKGALVIQTLYSSIQKENGIESIEHEIPFSEMIDIDGLEDDCLCNVSYEVKEVFYTVREDINGETRVISLDVVLRGHITASRNRIVNVVDDCYSTEGKEIVSRETLCLDELLSEGVSHLSLKEILTVPETEPGISGVYNLECKPRVTELTVEGEILKIRGRLATFVLYGSAEESRPMSSLVREFDFEHAIPVDGADENTLYECGVTDQSISFTFNAASEIELRCSLEFYTKAVRKREMYLVSGCEIQHEETEKEPARGLIIYFARRGDTLWDVAKRYKMEQKRIMEMNQMDDEIILAGQKLLIPGR